MAFAHGKWSLAVSLVDQGKHKSILRFDLQGTTAAEAEANAATVVGNIVAMTDAWIDKYVVENVFVTDVLFTAAMPHGKISDRALVTVALTTPGKNASYEVPCPKDAIFVSTSGDGYENVNPANAAVSAYCNQYIVGGAAYISDGENTVTGGFVKGKRVGRHNTGG